jgi:hypothetical protein
MIRFRSVVHVLVAVFMGTHALSAQVLALGVKGGIRTTGDLTGDAISESKRYIVGPMFELRLPFGFGAEVDALYSRFGYTTTSQNLGGIFTDRERANSWEFPILLKYRLPGLIVHPYAEAGYAPRTISGSGSFSSTVLNLLNGGSTHMQGSLSTPYEVSHGVVIGAGIEAGLPKFRIAPEIRYTHWSNTPVNITGSQGYFVQSAQNQFDLLVGITWH